MAAPKSPKPSEGTISISGPPPKPSEGTISIAAPPARAGTSASSATSGTEALSALQTAGGGGSGTISLSPAAVRAAPSTRGGSGDSGTVSVAPAVPVGGAAADDDPDGTLAPARGRAGGASAATDPFAAGASADTVRGAPSAPAPAAAKPAAPVAGPDGLPVVGQRFGPYELKSELGRGGMGVVFRALHLALNREVALKLMLAQETTEEQRTRFLREAEASAALQHPYIVAVHDVGVEDGKLFFSMDFVPGKMLKAVMKERKGDLRALLGIFTKICEGIGYAHRKGIIHRDLKPQNVMVDADLNPHVMDFGLARLDVGKADAQEGVSGGSTGATSGASAAPGRKAKARLTRVGAVMGTPVYMPPEQAGGRIDEVDTRSDLYSLGVILYAMLTDALPFQAPSMPELLLKIENDAPIAPREHDPACPWELERIALKAIAKAREDRYQDAFELRDDVQAWLDGFPVAAAGGGALYRAGKFVRRNRTLVGVSAAALIAVSALGASMGRAARAERRAREDQVASLVAGARSAIAEGDAARARAVAEGAGTEAVAPEALERLGAALAGYGEALRKLAAAQQLAPTSMAVSEAGRQAELGQQAAKALERDALERKARADALAQARGAARGAAERARAALAALDPGGADDLDEVAALRRAIDEQRVALVSALQNLQGDPGERVAQDGLVLVVAKLRELDAREQRFVHERQLAEYRRQAQAELEAARAAKTDEALRAHIGKAISFLTQALLLDPDDRAVRGLRVEAALTLGERALANGDLVFAEYVIDEVRLLDRERTGAFADRVRAARQSEERYAAAMQQAEVARAAERWKDAAGAYQEAVQAAPGRAEAAFGLRFARAGAAFEDGRLDDALAALAEAGPLADAPFDRAQHGQWTKRVRAAVAERGFAAARAAADEQRWAEAEAALARVFAHDPEHEAARRLASEVGARKSVPEGMLLVNEGAFTFGPPASARDGVACPAFFLGRTEVTNREYLGFVAAGGYATEALWDPEGWAAREEMVGRDGRPGPVGWSNGRPPAGKEELPVTGVSWYEARAFARWKGPGYRLPSEVEWEKAAVWDASARRVVDPPWIARGPDGQARSSWQSLWGAYFGRSEAKPVGAPAAKNESGAALYDASPSGALDLWGNVRELVVAFDEEGGERAGVRGGSFAARLEERALPWTSYRPLASFRAHDVGFRLARSAGGGQ